VQRHEEAQYDSPHSKCTCCRCAAYEAIGSELSFVARFVLVVGFVRQGKLEVNERGLDDVFSASARNRASAALAERPR
jgi:hypothetical protein